MLIAHVDFIVVVQTELVENLVSLWMSQKIKIYDSSGVLEVSWPSEIYEFLVLF